MEKILEEEIDENYEPTVEEIIKYGIWLGLTLPDDEDLLYIACEGLKAPLPPLWKRYKTREGDIYYFNSETSQSKWEHPCGSHYKQLVREAKHLNELKKVKYKTNTSLFNYQVSITNDFNTNLKETENSLSVIGSLKSISNFQLFGLLKISAALYLRSIRSTWLTNSAFNLQLMQTHQDYFKAYQQKTSLYSIREYNNRTELIIYNTESKTQEVKILKTPEPLDFDTCIYHLPNGKLFCFGNNRDSGISVLIDVNGEVEVLPSGTPCSSSSCIYFNNSVYCFGGNIYGELLTLSSRFDLDQNQWIQLTPMPIEDHQCSSIVFNRDILISGLWSRNLLLYSIDIDSFSTIPYEFVGNKRKILINADRLYLIECYKGSIYECEVGSCTNWSWIKKSTINGFPSQVCCSYNKGGIYIGCGEYLEVQYFKFDLNKKLIVEL